MTASKDLLGQLAESAPRHLAELVEWLRIPSVSSDSTRVNEVKTGSNLGSREAGTCWTCGRNSADPGAPDGLCGVAKN